MSDKAFSASLVMFFAWITVWMISYDNIWLKIPVIADLFPLPLPNGNLSYAGAVTSIGIVGTLILAFVTARFGVQASKEATHWH